jgi:hypothetical protein
MKLEFSRQIFEKYSNIKFHENQSSGSRVVPYGRTDRHDEANSRFLQSGESASQTKTGILWDVTPINLVEQYQNFGGTSCLHITVDVRGGRLHQNVGICLPNYMTPHSGKPLFR